MKSKSKIIGSLVFVSLILAVFYFTFFSVNEVKDNIEIIKLSGNNYLTQEQYFRFAKLNNIKEYKNLTLHIIKDRLKKHPYVEDVSVKYIGKDIVGVTLTEKKVEAVLVYNEDQFFITRDLQLLPVMSMTKNIDLPVITNPYLKSKPKAFEILSEGDITTAVKMIETAKLIDNTIFQNLTEINMRYGKDILVSFRDFNFPVIVGRTNESAKLIYFDKIWDKIIKNKETADAVINYVDLRFDNLIYVGTAETKPETEGTQG